MDLPCQTCAGSGWIDEDQADGLGLEIPDGRTDVCPHCYGTGQASWPLLDLLMALFVVAVGALALGVMVGFCIWGLRHLGALL